MPELKPSVEDVSLLLRTRTVGGEQQGGLGADTGPQEVTVFDENTRPTSDEVVNVIVMVYNDLLGDVTGGEASITDDLAGKFKHAVALKAAVWIEVSFFRESVNQDLLDLWRDEIAADLEKINDELTGAGVTPSFGTLYVGSIRRPPVGVPEPDYLPGVDFP